MVRAGLLTGRLPLQVKRSTPPAKEPASEVTLYALEQTEKVFVLWAVDQGICFNGQGAAIGQMRMACRGQLYTCLRALTGGGADDGQQGEHGLAEHGG